MNFKNLSKILIISSCLLINIEPALAVENTVNEIISPRVEKTGYKYKTEKGFTYKRLWSYTNQCWIDPYWIKV